MWTVLRQEAAGVYEVMPEGPWYCFPGLEGPRAPGQGVAFVDRQWELPGGSVCRRDVAGGAHFGRVCV